MLESRSSTSGMLESRSSTSVMLEVSASAAYTLRPNPACSTAAVCSRPKPSSVRAMSRLCGSAMQCPGFPVLQSPDAMYVNGSGASGSSSRADPAAKVREPSRSGFAASVSCSSAASASGPSSSLQRASQRPAAVCTRFRAKQKYARRGECSGRSAQPMRVRPPAQTVTLAASHAAYLRSPRASYSSGRRASPPAPPAPLAAGSPGSGAGCCLGRLMMKRRRGSTVSCSPTMKAHSRNATHARPRIFLGNGVKRVLYTRPNLLLAMYFSASCCLLCGCARSLWSRAFYSDEGSSNLSSRLRYAARVKSGGT